MTLPPLLHAERPLTIAHRGSATLWPENTCFAFTQALAAGSDLLETDLRMTRDGELVLCHDASVDRTTNGSGEVAELTLSELQALDAGYRFTRDGVTFPHRGQGLTVPTLAEALALGPTVRLNLDLKPRDPAIVGRLVDMIELTSAHDRLVVASEHDGLLQRFRAATGGRVATSAGVGEVTAFWSGVQLGLAPWNKPAFDALQVPPHRAFVNVVNEAFVAAAQRAGVQVHVWTIDVPSQMRHFLDLGVDGIITNRPDRLVPIISRHLELESEPWSLRDP